MPHGRPQDKLAKYDARRQRNKANLVALLSNSARSGRALEKVGLQQSDGCHQDEKRLAKDRMKNSEDVLQLDDAQPTQNGLGQNAQKRHHTQRAQPFGIGRMNVQTSSVMVNEDTRTAIRRWVCS